MKPDNQFWMLALALFVSSAPAVTTAAGQGRAAAYRFESAPRPVLAPVVRAACCDPKLGLWASGRVYLLALYGSAELPRLGLAVSEDGGDTFGPPVPISAAEQTIRSDGEDSPSLAVGPHGGVYALWEQERSDGGTDLLFARSTDEGHRFQKPIVVTDKRAPSANDFSTLGVAPDGSLYAVWLDSRDPESGPHGTAAVYLARSTDGGATFGKNIQVAAGACHCSRPALAFGAQGEVFVAWRAVLLGDIRDVVVAVSLDQGESFGPRLRVAKDNWRIDGCPHSGPSLAVKGDRLYVSWFSEGTGRNPGVRVAWSDDGGQNFGAARIVSGGILDPNHPVLSASEDGRVVLIFQGRDPGRREGWAPAQAYFAEIGENGVISPPAPLPGRRQPVVYPTVAAGTMGRVFVAWSEPGDHGRRILFLRGRKTEPKRVSVPHVTPPTRRSRAER